MTGYRLQLPEGWVRTRLTGDLDNAVDRVVERTLPRERFGDSDGAVARFRLREDLRRSFNAAADAGAVDIYSFEGEVSGVRLPMSFSVSVAHFGAAVGALPLEAFAQALGDPGDARVVDFPAGAMIRARRERSEAAGAVLHASSPVAVRTDVLSVQSQRAVEALDRFVADHSDVEISTATVDYLAPIPGEPGTFVLVSLMAPGPTDVEARVGHFDVLMAGFRWTR